MPAKPANPRPMGNRAMFESMGHTPDEAHRLANTLMLQDLRQTLNAMNVAGSTRKG